MPDNKNQLIVIIITSIIISSIFGASAGFLAINNSQVSGYLEKILPNDIALSRDENGNITRQQTVKVEEESAVIAAVEKVSPAVVSIIVTKDLPKLEQYYYNPFGDDPFFNDFFGGGSDFLVPGTRQNGTEKQEVGGGSGFIISTDGLVVTNKHVVLDEEAEYTVLMNDEKKYDAKVLARDPVNDLAVLKIDAQDLPTVELGDSDNLKVGQTLIAIGNALGEFRNTVSTGVVSGLARSITAGGGSGFAEDLTNIIQTDAAINPGNSGGPLLNIAGQVIGINTAVAQGAQGIGFAIPINEVKASIEMVKKNGKISRPWLGVRYVMLTEDIAKQNNLSISEGALIVRGDTRTDLAVVPGSPADKAGLAENDIILEADGHKLTSEDNLAKVISKYKPDDEAELKIWHKGEEKTVKVKLGEYGS
ncbi:MAG: trypsin-like peptidase domain-containing protein [Patescibacteria group bacterium]|jgi:S1-C subfamily serine protease